jgi:hypothetical protein
LAFPGPGKIASCKGEFAGLWAAARDALIETEQVLCLGYRMPPTDAHARTALLDAIAENGHSKSVKIVLGEDINRPEIARMKSLLSTSVSQQRCEALPFFTEDFLSKWKP